MKLDPYATSHTTMITNTAARISWNSRRRRESSAHASLCQWSFRCDTEHEQKMRTKKLGFICIEALVMLKGVIKKAERKLKSSERRYLQIIESDKI